jgi:NhaP-type Na+/H+ or K+/H+ antiporter
MADPKGSPPAPQPQPQPEPEAKPLAERLKGWLDNVLVADVFLVIGAALWFGLAVLLHSRGVEAPLQLFERLWQPLFLPAISLLMAAAIVSGVLGWWRRRGQR